ncbi:MAG: AAA family ATPase [Victivallales bacterium]|nr:AAA family ATPase [Victivallales bacterium]
MPAPRKTITQVTMRELKEIVLNNLQALWEPDSFLATKYSDAPNLIPPIMLWGAPGVGKSTLVRELTTELGVGFIDVRLAQREPVDMRGLPVPENDSVKWLISSEWPRDPSSRGIILFDELTAADRTLQVASYEFILDRRLGDLYRVPRGWYIMAAGNRAEDRAVATAMSSALANRFLHLEVKPDAQSFLEWATENDLHPAVINFIRYRPELLFSQDSQDLQRGWPSPRSWERVSTLLKITDKYGNKRNLKYTVPGLVGEGAAVEFLTFYRDMFYQQKNTDVRKLLLTGQEILVPQRPDQLYACCGAIAYYMKMERDKKAFDTMLPNFLAFCLKLPDDFSQMLMSDTLSVRNKERQGQITSHPLYQQWLAKVKG